MARVYSTQTSFTAGELDPQLMGRLDLKALEEGAARLRNVLVHASGGVSRRPGLARVASLPGARRLIGMDGPAGPVIVALGGGAISLVRNGAVSAGPACPWSDAQLESVAWTRLGEELLIVHRDLAPRRLRWTAAGAPELVGWTWESSEEGSLPAKVHQPYARFAAPEVALQLRSVSTGQSDDDLDAGLVDLVASERVFTADHVGTIVRYKGHLVTISSVDAANPSKARGLLHEKIANGQATRDWDEQAFSSQHGWPASVTSFQDRLVIGGSRGLPDRMWLSKTGQYFNFDLGGGLDDEAIAFRLAAEARHEIRSLHHGRQLQVFTSRGEWIVRGFPLTPGSVQVELQTGVGSWLQRRVAPVDVDGATLFVGASGRELREYLFSDSEQAYQAADIALLARHLMQDAVDIAWDGRRRTLWIVRGDGKAAAVTIDRNSNVVAWSLVEPEGSLRAVAVHEGETYVLAALGGAVLLSRVDEALGLDHARTLTSPAPTAAWAGLGELEGREVIGIAGGGERTRSVVRNGTMTLPRPAATLTVGLPFTHSVQPMPTAVPSGRGISLDQPYRPVRITFRLLDTWQIRVDVGDGARPLLGGGEAITGDRAVRALGWLRGLGPPPWRIEQDDPLPATLLSVTTEIKVND